MIFSAVRKGKDVFPYANDINPGDDITFDETVTNIGSGMDPESGVFTAPVSGIYSFSFSALLYFEKEKLREWGIVEVLKGGQVEFNIKEHHGDFKTGEFEGINYSWMMSLAQNEEVNLRMYERSESQIMVYNDPGNPSMRNFVWFNGQLLDASE